MAAFCARLVAFLVLLFLAAVGVMGLVAADPSLKGLICPFAAVSIVGLGYLALDAMRQILSAEPPAADDGGRSSRGGTAGD